MRCATCGSIINWERISELEQGNVGANHATSNPTPSGTFASSAWTEPGHGAIFTMTSDRQQKPRVVKAARREFRRQRELARTSMPNSTSISELPNLGPKSRQVLALAGITTFAQLRRIGSVAAYCKAKRAGTNVSLNLLWALEGALTGLPWQTVAREHRTSLLLALEQCGIPRPSVQVACCGESRSTSGARKKTL